MSNEIEEKNGWVKVRSRGDNGWIKTSEVQKERILEVNFVDIGQGDGCHVVMPDDRHFVIDAGEGDNMHRFLSWRYNLRRKKNSMNDLTAIISHPDQDHYKGFQQLFDNSQLSFSKIYHNGLVERANDPSSTLGSSTKIKGRKYLNDIIKDDASMKALLNDPSKRYRKNYPKTLYKAIQNPSNSNVEFNILHKDRKFVPGYEDDKDVTLKVLGPILEKDDSGTSVLKYFKSPGKTKNGHSVILKLEIGKLKVLLGGDLNIESENFLLEKYTGVAPDKLKKKIHKEEDQDKLEVLNKQWSEMIEKGTEVFRSDVAKACHHGSHHFTTEYLQSVDAIATVISSGDNESHCHPRPDALGAFGKYGRGERPLIFSTELARSHKETIKKPHEYKRSISYHVGKIDKETDPDKKKKLEKKLDQILATIERTVAVYGMICLRTDGDKAIITQKLETPRGKDAKWDIHELIYNDSRKEFEYKVKLKH